MTRVAVAKAWEADYRRRVPERTREMARLYVEQGLSYEEVGEQYGLTRQRVCQLLKPLGVARDRGRRSHAERVQILRAAHARIMGGESTLAAEASKLGYKTGRSLRAAFYELDLRVILDNGEPPHGSYARYRSRQYRCRCDECRRANREQQAKLRGLEPPEHGTYSAYINYECRCQACKEGYALYVRDRKAKKRRKKEVVV